MVCVFHTFVQACVHGPSAAQPSSIHLSNAATGNGLPLEPLKQVVHACTKGPPDGGLSEQQGVHWSLCVQLGQLLAEVWGEHIAPGGRPLTPLDEGRAGDLKCPPAQ